MYLKQITINGFKSFADKTQIVLTKGITCIVGPNGCGKSNIVDSIRWVLGEQSAKALRGGKMQDVIFQGTETRKPLQLCEVSLTFSDCEAQLGTNFNEVEITRRVVRDGGSDYFINGKPVRLKDIQNLFMDTGIGRVSYSFMVQGQIDQILSSNPGERRSIFEEAAGITKYKTQRREALNKLALVDQNLARATDRMEEIGRQIGTLKRQASKALRHQRLSWRLRHLDLALTAKNYASQAAAAADDEKNLAAVSEEILKLNAKLAEAETKLSALRAEREEAASALELLRESAAEIRSRKEQAAQNGEFAAVRRRDLGERTAQIEREMETLSEQLESLAGKAEGESQVKQMQLDLVSENDEIFRQQTDELSEIERKLSAAEQSLSQAKQNALASENTVTRLRVNCTSLEVDLKSYQVRHAAISDAAFQRKEERAAMERRIEELESARESANESLASAEADVQEAVKKSDELRGQYRSKQAEIQNMDRQVASQSARLSLLNDFQTRMEGFSEGAKAIMKGRLSSALPPEAVKIVSQSANVAEGWTGAFEAMLGTAIDAIALKDGGALKNLLDGLREQHLGNACFAVDFSARTNATAPAPALPDGVFDASKLVGCADPELEPFVSNLVRNCYFCEDISAFALFAQNTPAFKFALAVSRDGSLMDSRGIVCASSGEARTTESSFLMRGEEIRRLKAAIERDNDALTTLNEQAMAIQSSLDDAEAEIENKRNESGEIKRQLASIGAQVSNAQTQLEQNAAETKKLDASLAEMENSRFEAEDRLSKAKRDLAEAEKTISESKDTSAKAEEEIAALRRLKDEKYEILSETRLQLASKKSKLENLERGIGAIIQQQAETKILLEKRAQEKSQIAEQSAALERQTAEESARAEAENKKLEETLSEIEIRKEAFKVAENKIAEFENSIYDVRKAHMASSQTKNELEVRIATAKSKMEFVSERVMNEYGAEISSVNWKDELWKSDEEFQVKVKLDDLEDGEISAKPKRERGTPTQEDFDKMDSADFGAIEAEVRELRDKIAAMGAINLVAIEEYAELKERYDFLKAQTDDLWKSKNSLVADIDEINATSQKMFSETFEQIRKNFLFTFQKIFGGGTADLKLVESEDVLDSGIEIVARPAGSLLKSLSLLSGGQRTMTAVSLLFAIYMVKPSPFCVLDELDAPLDDANIGRYTDMLREFTKYSQFLVISHNKRTMSAAQTIYGVTMQERGVTRLVSMRINQNSTANDEGALEPVENI